MSALSKSRNRVGWRAALAIGAACLVPAGLGHAGLVPWSNRTYSHYANAEPLASVVKSFMASQGIPVVVSEKVKDVVSLRYEDLAPAAFMDKLASAHRLLWYYDGSVMFVYSGDEIQTATLKLQHLSVEDFTQMASDMGIRDARFAWQGSSKDRVIYVSGPPRFVELTMELARAQDKPGKSLTGPVAYRWVDARGVTHLSSSPPPPKGVRYTVVDLRTFATTEVAGVSK